MCTVQVILNVGFIKYLRLALGIIEKCFEEMT